MDADSKNRVTGKSDDAVIGKAETLPLAAGIAISAGFRAAKRREKQVLSIQAGKESLRRPPVSNIESYPVIMMKRLIFVLLAVLAAVPLAAGQSRAAQTGDSPKSSASLKSSANPQSSANPKPNAKPSLLPPVFNGWELEKPTLKTGSDPAAADPTDYAVLKEYGFSDFALATYSRNGRSMQIKAARFADASGAYGAFTYFLQPQMLPETIGDRAGSNTSRILFYRGNVLVDARLEHVSAMSAADLRALADALPRPHGNLSALPTLPGHLPKNSIANSEHYIVGPIALERLGVPLPASLVNFPMGPEVEFAQYVNHMGGVANFTLIEYPTPQIAAERMKAMQAAGLPAGPFYFKRSGPLLAVVNGGVDENEARDLMASVAYDADVTWNQPTKRDARDNIGNLIIGIFVLIGFILLVSVIFGLAFGGVRIVAKKFFPDRVFDRPEDVEVIRLNLK